MLSLYGVALLAASHDIPGNIAFRIIDPIDALIEVSEEFSLDGVSRRPAAIKAFLSG